jgi:LacI family transcriptional regulator
LTTIVDVARAAGVSPATVSRVLNGSERVSAERAERVRQAAGALGYQPFGPARALRRQRTQVWAVVIADIENPFFTSMVRGIEDVAHAEDHRLVLCNTDEDIDKQSDYFEVVAAERMAGAIVALASSDDSALDRLLDRGIAVVTVDRRPNRDGLDSVVVDNRLGAQLATTHLLDSGSTRVACITGPNRVPTAPERLEGYRDAIRAVGGTVERALIRRANYREDGGYRAARSLLEGDDPPDSILVANNLMSLGALRAIRELGLAVPADVAMVGFDEAPWTPLLDPPLTVVEQPSYELGRQAARLLATADPDRSARHLVLSPTLIVRASSVRP